MCLLGGTLLLARYLMVFFGFATSNVSSDFTDWRGVAPLADTCRTTEWLRGESLCTFRGKYHLAWSVPMSDVSYWTPSAAIHSFLMFGPFFIMKRNMMIQGIFLWLAGPYLASWITANLMEQASIWCFFSIAQIGIMLFIIREQLLLNWGRSKKKVENGAANGHSNGHSAPATSEKTTANKTTSSKKKGGKAKAK
eukprot:TRINITY_DN12894_c0_g2_i2.p1 TRINITY_DN12894_c0_g2~~TRINITY_DN12894_c0_g2_i2.p1  ORF type:complete len:195 (+),score=43.56 TRINITY_DN12894_c0_g2_i2:89-673(+)